MNLPRARPGSRTPGESSAHVCAAGAGIFSRRCCCTPLSYLLFLNGAALHGCRFKHTYEVFPSRFSGTRASGPAPHRRYDTKTPIQNLVSERWGWLNLLVLNFPYHNRIMNGPGNPGIDSCAAPLAVCRERSASNHVSGAGLELSPASVTRYCPTATGRWRPRAHAPAVSLARRRVVLTACELSSSR